MKLTAAILLLIVATNGAYAQSRITGRVVNGTDSTAVPAARVVLLDRHGDIRASAFSDSAGYYRVTLLHAKLPDTFFVSVERIGFTSITHAPVRLVEKENIVALIELLPKAVALAPITVVARARYRAGFLDEYSERREEIRRGMGTAIDADVLHRYAGASLQYPLARAPGLRFERIELNGSYANLPVMRGCIPLVYLDKMPIPADELAEMDPASLAGVLIYTADAVPYEYQTRLAAGDNCGLILAFSDWSQPKRQVPFKKFMIVAVSIAALVLLENKVPR